MSLGAVVAPRGSDTPVSELEYIVEQSGSSFIVLETGELLEEHGEYLKKCKQLKDIL